MAGGYGPHGNLTREQYQQYLKLGGKPVVGVKPKVKNAFDLRAPDGRIIVGQSTNAINRAAGRTGSKAFRQRAETLRRQRTLRAAGFGIVVDGVWGPRSQAAWLRYQRGQGRSVVFKDHPLEGAVLPFTRLKDREAQLEAQAQAAQSPEAKLAADKAAALLIKKARQEKIAAQQATILRHAVQLRNNPALAARMSLADLTRVVIDKKAKFNPGTSTQAALAVQYNLRAKGFKNVDLTGVFDKNTYNTLKRAFKQQEQRERIKRLRAIRDELYSPLRLTTGERPAGFPLGEVPSPDKLDALIQANGTTGRAIQMWFQRQIATDTDAFATARLKQLTTVARDFQPFTLPLRFGGNLNLVQILGAIYGVNDLAHHKEGEDPAKRAKDPSTRLENAQLIMELRDQTNALMKANTPKQFAEKLAAYQKVSEEKFKRAQAKIAAESVPWWGKTLEKIAAPGEFMRTVATYEALSGIQWIDRQIGGNEAGVRDIQWEDAAVVLGEDPASMPDYDGLAESTGGIRRFGFSVIADPLNFATPFKWGSMAAKVVSGSERMGGYAITGTRIWDKALVYNKGTWSKAAGLARVPGAGAVGGTDWFQKLHATGKALSSLKEDRIQAVAKRISVMGRNGFKLPIHPAAAGSFKLTKPPSNLAAVDKSRQGIVQLLEDHEYEDVFGELMREVTREGDFLSVYVHASRDELSNVGASLLGSMAEKGRVTAAHQDATEMAVDMIERTGYTNKVLEFRRIYKTKVKPGTLAAKERAQHLADLREEIDGIRDSIVKSYSSTLADAGAFLTGGVADVAKAQDVYRRTTAKMDTIEDALFPSMQDVIERRADEWVATQKTAARESGEVAAPVAHPLWEEDGRWAGRNGSSANRLRERNRALFDEENLIEVDNAAYGKPHTEDEAMAAIEFETRRAIPRIHHWAAREARANGVDVADGIDVVPLIAREKDKIRGNWEKRKDNNWYDVRPKIKVNKLYARNFSDSVVSREKLLQEILDPDTGTLLSDGIERLALSPSFESEDALDAALWQIMWQFGARFKKFRGPGSGTLEDALVAGKTGRKLRTPVPPDGISKVERKDFFNQEFERLGKITSAFSQHKIDLADAADSVLSSELKKEHLYMSALARAQSKHAKAAYMALHWSMKSWVFATLPLRSGWVVRNIVDNFAKAVVAGVHDPRKFFLGGENPMSWFGVGINPLRGIIRLFDHLFGTKALAPFDALLEKFWEMPTEILTKLLGAEALPTPPPAALDGARFSEQVRNWRSGTSGNPYSTSAFDYETVEDFTHEKYLKLTEAERMDLKKKIAEKGSALDRLYFKMRYEKSDTLWDLMGNRPENYFKRVIYRDVYQKELAKGLTAARAEARAKSAIAPRVNVPLSVDGDMLWAHVMSHMDIPEGHTLKVMIARPGQHLDLNEVLATNAPSGTDLNRGLRGLFEPTDAKNARLTIFVPEEMSFTSREGFDKFQGQIAHAVEHEMRHAVQWQSWVGRKVRPLDRKLPYRWQMDEIEARFFGRRNAERVPEIVSGDKEALAELPQSLIDYAEVHAEAQNKAWDTVTETLFDYGQVSVAEDSLRLFFPFIQFWRKNTLLWAGNFGTKPWLDNAILQFDNERQKSHRDLPLWMQRYIHTDEIVDAAATVPGLGELVEAMLPGDMQIDPLSFMSFTPLHRAWRDLFYGENQNLPADEKGMRIIGPMVEAMNNWGLGMSPFIRKPLEVADVVDSRTWQMVFPQTSLAVAFAMPFIGQDKAFKIADWERVFTFLMGKAPSKALAQNFDFYVNQEVANQVKAGEFVNRDVAEANIRLLFYTQQLWAYFGGTYWRRATPEDIYISKLQDDVRNFEIDYSSLTPKQKELLKLWAMRKQSPEDMDRYLTQVPAIEAFYRETDFQKRDEMMQQNPALIEWVAADPPQRKGIGQTWIRNAQKYTDTAQFFRALELAKSIDAPSHVKSAAYDVFATPELREWWARNDTPAQIKDRMVQAETYRYMNELNKAYFKIPGTDYDARDGFLQQHPELVQHWNRHNHASDNYEAVMDSTKAALRDMYFSVLDKKGFDKAAPILKQFPFMFEGTKSEGKVKNGEWVGSGNGKHKWSKDRREAWGKVAKFAKWFFDVHMKKVGEDKAWDWLRKSDATNAKLFRIYLDKYGKKTGGNWTAERRALYNKAQPYMKWFFDVFMPRVGEDKAWAWLDSAEGDGAKLIKEYLKKYSKSSSVSSVDYMKAKPYLAIYEKMAPADRAAWLKGDSKAAKTVRWFFDKYGSDFDMSARAKAYLEVKADLDYYGSLPKEKRQAWLDSDDPRAKKVKDFFKKFGKHHQFEKAFKKLIAKHPELAHGTPEQAERMRFWKQYYDLPPDERPAFVHDHAEDAGIFIYGDFSDQYRHDREREYTRRAIGLGISERAAAALYVKPLLEFYGTLDKDEKPLFLRANPELQQYFDKYVTSSPTGDKKLDVLVEKYFKLTNNSVARSEFLRKYPQVQDFFDSKASPAERAIRATLEQYFDILDPDVRAEYLKTHPEVQLYFDRRKAERDSEKSQLEAFDDSDPRLAPFMENASDLIRGGERERERLKASALRRLSPDALESRRERRPLRT